MPTTRFESVSLTELEEYVEGWQPTPGETLGGKRPKIGKCFKRLCGLVQACIRGIGQNNTKARDRVEAIFVVAVSGDDHSLDMSELHLSYGRPKAPKTAASIAVRKPTPPVMIPTEDRDRGDTSTESLEAKCLRFQDLAGWIDLKLRTRPPEKVMWDDCVKWLQQEPRIQAMQPDELAVVLSVVKGFIHAS